MVVEIATFEIRPGAEEAFRTAYGEAKRLVAECAGCQSMRLVRGVESSSRFVLLVEWDTLEAHTEGFRGSDRFPAWRALLSPHFAVPPAVEHYADVVGRPGG
jgi:heme-degrading monooxygenase HmoA